MYIVTTVKKEAMNLKVNTGSYMRGFVFGGKKGMRKLYYYIIISKYKKITKKKNVHIYRVLYDVLVVMCFLIIFLRSNMFV